MKATVKITRSAALAILEVAKKDQTRQFPASSPTSTGCTRYRTVATGTWSLDLTDTCGVITLCGGVKALLDSLDWILPHHRVIYSTVTVTESSVPAWVTERLIRATLVRNASSAWDAWVAYSAHVEVLKSEQVWTAEDELAKRYACGAGR